MRGLLDPEIVKLLAGAIAKRGEVELADLSQVSDPIGRVDYLASRLIAQGVQMLSPEAQAAYHAAKPLIDGVLTKHLTQRVEVPQELVEFMKLQIARSQGAMA